MEELTNVIHEYLGLSPLVQGQIVKSILVILVLWVVRRALMRVASSQRLKARQVYIWRNIISYITLFVGILLIIRIWFRGGESVLTYFGLLSAGVVVALQAPLVNLAGWFFMIFRSPIKVGDRIQLGEYAGDVIDMRLFQFTINEIGNWVDGDQSTGRIINIPNGKIFSEALANYSRGLKYIWHEIAVVVSYESNWRSAKKIIEKVIAKNADDLEASAQSDLRESSKDFLLIYKNFKPIVYTKADDHGVRLTMRFLCDPRQRRGKENDIWEDLLDAFEKEVDIDLAYPTTRFYNNKEEGRVK